MMMPNGVASSRSHAAPEFGAMPLAALTFRHFLMDATDAK
jgi:hypothetical protein